MLSYDKTEFIKMLYCICSILYNGIQIMFHKTCEVVNKLNKIACEKSGLMILQIQRRDSIRIRKRRENRTHFLYRLLLKKKCS